MSATTGLQTDRRSTAGHPRSASVGRPWLSGPRAVLAVALVPTAVYFLVVLRNMTYAWDDFVQFGVTTQFGVGRELLAYNLFEHFGPVNRLAHGLLVSWGGLDVRWGIGLALVVFYVYCASLVDLARVLGATWVRTWLALAVCTVTPCTVFVGAFFDPFTHVLIPVAASAVAMAACIRWSGHRRARYAVVATGAVAVACLTQERGIFIVVLVVGTRLLIADRRLPIRSWVGTVLREWAFFIGPVLVAATTGWIVATYYVTDAARGGIVATAEFVARSWTTQFVPMLTGVYDVGTGPLRVALVVLANLVVVTLIAWSIRRDIQNVRPWLLLVSWFALHMTFVGFGRLGVGSIETFLADPNFYSYQLPVVAAVVASLRLTRLRSAPEPERSRIDHPAVHRAGVVLVAVLIVGSSLPLASRSEAFGPDYLATSVPAIRQANADGPASIAPTQVPGALVPPGFGPYNSGEFYLRQADPETVVDLDPADPLFLDSSGRVTAATATLLATVSTPSLGGSLQIADGEATLGDDGYCVTSSGLGHLSAPLPASVTSPGGALWVRLLTQGTAASVRPASWSGSDWTNGPPSSVDTATGAHSYVLDTGRIAQVDLLDLDTADLCVQEIQIYALSAEGPAGCGWVAADGSIVPAVNDSFPPRCRP